MTRYAERFDQDTQQYLAAALEKLPRQVRLHIWGDPEASWTEHEAVRLAETLAERFDALEYHSLPRRENYPYYPVIGVMLPNGGEVADDGVRIIGLPRGKQLTSLIAAIQAVAFRGQQLEPLTRIRLHQLSVPVEIQVLTAADDEGGAVMAGLAFSLAAASPLVRSYLIMADAFPEAALRYSATHLPHTVINNRVHVDGIVDEATMLKQIARAVG